MPPSIRPATEADFARLAEIYNVEVAGSNATFDVEPQPADRFAPYVADRTLSLLVAEVDGQVVGYAAAGRYRPRHAYEHSREVSVYIAADQRGRGLARALYLALHEELRAFGMHTAIAVIALPNHGSVRLHESLGYVHAGTVRDVGRKFDQWIDTATYQLMLKG